MIIQHPMVRPPFPLCIAVPIVNAVLESQRPQTPTLNNPPRRRLRGRPPLTASDLNKRYIMGEDGKPILFARIMDEYDGVPCMKVGVQRRCSSTWMLTACR